MNKSSVILFYTFTFFLLSACVVPSPTDLRMTDLDLVEIQTITGKEIDNGRYLSENSSFYRMKLSFISKIDLWKYARENDYLLHNNAFICDKPDVKLRITKGSIYWNEIDIEASFFHSESPIKTLPGEEIKYHLHLGIYSPPSPSRQKNKDGINKNEFEVYDLVQKAEDICVFIEARAMFTSKESNIMKIDKKQINDTLMKLRQ